MGNVSALKRENSLLKEQIMKLSGNPPVQDAPAEVTPAETPPADSAAVEIPVPTETAEVAADTSAEVVRDTPAEESVSETAVQERTQKYSYDLSGSAVPTKAAASDKAAAAVKIQPKTEKVFIPPEPKTHRVSTINIILILGALFLSLSGLIFAVTTWGVLNTFFKTVVLLSFSVIFFGLHSFTERKLRLMQTGRIFYTLGSIFLPVSIIASGVLEVFGKYFSFNGDGAMLVLAVTCLSICVCFFKGAHDYRSKVFSAISHYSFSAMTVLTIWQFSPRGDVAVLLSSVYSLMVVLLEPLIIKLYDRLFGEDNVFSAEYGLFSVIGTTIIGAVSLFAFAGETYNVLTLIGFAAFSVCFLTKSVTEKNSSFGALAFAFFLSVSAFSGIRPDDVTGFAAVIASVSLIFAVISVMGIFPDTLKNVLRVLTVCAVTVTGILAVVDALDTLTGGQEMPSAKIIISAAVVTAQLVILALRTKQGIYKALSFCGALWLFGELSLLTGLDGWIYAIAFGALLAYYIVLKVTPLKNHLYAPACEVILAVHGMLCTFFCVGDTEFSSFIALGIIAATVIALWILEGRTIASILCPIVTFQAVIPLFYEFDTHFFTLPLSEHSGTSALTVMTLIFCVTSAVLLFIPKAKKFAVSYGIGILCIVPLLVIFGAVNEDWSIISMLAVTAYSAVFCGKQAFPNGKFACVGLPVFAALLTSVFLGLHLDVEKEFLWCFPAVALLIVFALYALGEAFDTFENVNPHLCRYIWWAAPIIGGMLIISGDSEESAALIIFGAALSVCAGFTSVLRRNTMNMIFPIITISAAVGGFTCFNPLELALIPVVILALGGRLLFRGKLFGGIYSDVFSIGAFLPVAAYIFETGSDIMKWVGILLLTLLTANLLRREQSGKVKLNLLTALAVFIFPIMWAQPFFEVPSLIEAEYNLLPLVIFCVLLKIIRRDAPNGTDTFSFISAIFALVILFFCSMDSGESFDAVFIGVVLFIMLAVSFIIRKKRWFVLAVTSMVASGVLLSFGQKDSIAWLIYLVIAGASLIALGLANEMKKQQQKNGEETKLSRFMSEWTW